MVIASEGANISFPSNAFEVISMNNSTVQVLLKQVWNQTGVLGALNLFYQASNSSHECNENINVPSNQDMIYTILCSDNFAQFDVNVYVGSDYVTEECEACAAAPANSTTMVSYRLEIGCQSQCQPPPRSGCDYLDINFETTATGASAGSSYGYVHPQSWWGYGFTVHAYGSGDSGFTPGNMARILDTTNSSGQMLDASFGSPNSACGGGGGIGMGAGGQSSNCAGLGNVIMIQQNNSIEQLPNPAGGEIVFDFPTPAIIQSLGVFNVREGGDVTFTKSGGQTELITIPSMAANSVVDLLPGSMDVADVESVAVRFNGVGAISNFGICHDSNTTLPPSGFAPPSETLQPTPSPTVTAAPSSGPLPVCSEDVVLLEPKDLQPPYPELPIVILEQGTEFVRFEIKNTYGSTVSNVFTQFSNKPTGEYQCYETQDLQNNQTVEYTAYCLHHVPLAIVDLWVTGQSAFNTGAEVPECCHPPLDISPEVVQYTFKVYCETKCPAPAPAPTPVPARALQATSTSTWRKSLPENDAPDAAGVVAEHNTTDSPPPMGEDPSRDHRQQHFCSSDDYPCNADSKNVHVCHYSAKDGYQTYCVPEPDSDVMRYYKKDYCGPCLGGYGAHQQHNTHYYN